MFLEIKKRSKEQHFFYFFVEFLTSVKKPSLPLPDLRVRIYSTVYTHIYCCTDMNRFSGKFSRQLILLKIIFFYWEMGSIILLCSDFKALHPHYYHKYKLNTANCLNPLPNFQKSFIITNTSMYTLSNLLKNVFKPSKSAV